MIYLKNVFLVTLAFACISSGEPLPFLCGVDFVKGNAPILESEMLTPHQMSYSFFPSSQPNSKTVVLIHGLGGDKFSWKNIAKNFSQEMNVLIYDVRGHGRSKAKGYFYSSSILAHDLKNLMAHLNIKSASVLGWSMGGRIAMRFGDLFPELTDTIIVEDMHMKSLKKSSQRALADIERAKLLQEGRTFETEEDYQTFAQSLFGETFSRYWEQHYVFRKEGKIFLKPSSADQGKLLWSNQGLGENLTDAMKNAKAPVLFMSGGDHSVLFGIGIEHIRENKPEAEIVTFHDTGHGIHHARESDFLRLVSAFIQRKDISQIKQAIESRKSQSFLPSWFY